MHAMSRLLALSERYEGHVVLGRARELVIPAVLLMLLVLAVAVVVRLRARERDWSTMALVFLFAGVAWFAGELKLNYLQQLGFSDRRPLPPFERYEPAGDPSLAGWLDAHAPQAAPADLTSPAGFRQWQRVARARLRRYLLQGDSLAVAQPQLRTLSDRRVDSTVTRYFVTVPGFDGTPLPAYLFRPAGDARRAGVLVLSGSGPGIVETAGIVDSYQHQVALALAQAGYVTLTPEFRGQGYLGPLINSDPCVVNFNAVSAGTSYASVVTRDLVRGLDLLSSLPFVDAARLGVTGVSKGGKYSLILAAVDTRVRAVVAQGAPVEALETRGARTSWNRRIAPVAPLCHVVTDVKNQVGPYDLAFLIAPRPLLLVSGDRDREVADMHLRSFPTVQRAFGLLGAGGAVQRVEVAGAHEYFVRPAVEFFDAALRAR